MFIGDATKNTITLFGARVWSDLLDEQKSLDQYKGVETDRITRQSRKVPIVVTSSIIPTCKRAS
jgi:hypothetical protein